MFYAQVIYTDKKGAGCMRGFGSESKLIAFVEKLRRDAEIKNSRGESIGRVWKDEHDGNNGKWRWAFDPDAGLTVTANA